MPTAISQQIEALAARVKELKPIIATEEATKTAFIGPFISNVLGYDMTDPREVIPEYTADVGVKKGEKVDYAIKSGDDFLFLIECKKIGEPLTLDHANQLVRYFNVTDTDFAILTNGEVYQFYTQLDEQNRMDQKPFMTIDLANIDSRLFPYLAKCTKSQFDSATITANAEQLKYIAEIKKELSALFKEPSDEWVKYIASRVTSRRMTAQNLAVFRELVMTAQAQFLRDETTRRLRSAQDFEDTASTPEPSEDLTNPPVEKTPDDVVTTDDEIEAYNIIRAICSAVVKPKDVTMRDAKTYCAILFQDNNRKPIARLYFDRKVPRIVLFDADKNEITHDIEETTDIYNYTKEIQERAEALASS